MSAAPPPLAAGELIDDQALTAAGDDAFRLGDFVTELVALCERAGPPVNVGLFGAWGSGKSSLANLLEQRFGDGEHENVAFARFDAFKYAGIALRRHLLSQLAESLGADPAKYSEELYRSSNTNTYRMPRRDALLRFLGLLLFALAAVTVVLLGAASIVGLISDTGKHGAFGPAFRGALRTGIPSLLFASGLIGTLLAIAGKTFTVSSTQAPPSTEEEFGRLFAELVSEVTGRQGCERIVVFVDELDRCSPGQVVAVLETIKTFLHIDPCVFVVAADRQAIEEAIGEQARQATPRDSVNPYYSAGGAYLDKIFQHQLALPPLLGRTLSRFALELIEDRPGAWAQIENKAELVTVLIPEHVRSPRRVKVLLNAFLLAYRLALTRAADGALDPDVAGRASELAKLVCLQTEFPLFAAELRVDARMVQATLALAENPEAALASLDLAGFSEEAFTRAGAYAAGRLPADVVIAGHPGAGTARDADTYEDGPPTHTDPDSQEDEEETDSEVESLVESQSRQLTAYLARTRKIPGPARDLVFLESSGAAFGLPAELADRIERAARNGIERAVLAAIGELPVEQRPNAIAQLCALARASIGIETENTCHCVLAALGSTPEGLRPVVDDVLVTLQVASGYELRSGDLPGALEVSLLSGSPAALDLREQVLSRPEATGNERLGLLVLSRAKRLGQEERARLGPVLAARILDSEPERVLTAAAPIANKQLGVLIAEQKDTLLGGLAEREPAEAAARMAALVSAAIQTRAGVARPLLGVLLALDTDAAREAAEPLLAGLAPIAERESVHAILTATRSRPISTWKRWIGPVSGKTARTLPDAAELFGQLCAIVLVRYAGEPRAGAQEAREAVALLAALAGTGAHTDPEPLRSAFAQLAGAPALVDQQSAERSEMFELLEELVKAGLLEGAQAASIILSDLTRTLTTAVALEANTQRLPRRTLEAANIALAHAEPSELDALIEAVKASNWMPGEIGQAILLGARARQAMLGETPAEKPDAEQLAAVAAIGTAADPALAGWVRAFAPSPQEVYLALIEVSEQRRVSRTLADALGELAEGWPRSQRETFADRVAEAYFTTGRGLALLALTRNAPAPEAFTAALLAKLFARAANNIERGRVMALWRTLAPQGAPARRTLIEKIYMPMLDTNKGAVAIALEHFTLVSEPPSQTLRNKLRSRLKRVVKGERGLQRRAEGLMLDAGWVRRGRLGRLTDT